MSQQDVYMATGSTKPMYYCETDESSQAQRAYDAARHPYTHNLDDDPGYGR